MTARQTTRDPPKGKTPAQPKRKSRSYLEFDPSAIPGRDLLTMPEAAYVLRVGMCKLNDLVLRPDPLTGKPALYSVKIGRKRLIPRRAIDRFIEGL